MGLKFGEIDVVQIIDNEYRSKVLEKLISFILLKNKLQGPSPDEMKAIRDQAIKELRDKYPTSGVKLIE